MGITVISKTSMASSGNSANALLSTEGGSGDFSALLTEQLAAALLSGTQSLAATLQPGVSKADSAATEIPEDQASVEDPGSLLAMAGLLPIQKNGIDLPQSKSLPPQAEEAIRDVASDRAGRNAEAFGLDRLAAALDGSKDKTGKDDALAALAGNNTRSETAIIAGDTKNASGNTPDFAATLAAQAPLAHAAAPKSEASPAAPQVATPLNDSRWAQDFGDKMVWLAKNDQQTAQIHINPPQLGPVHITLNLSGDQASAMFVSPHAEVRQAINDAMPQLREMLSGAGISLGQANVGAQLPQQQQQNGGTPQQFSNSSRFGNDNAILPGEIGHTTTALPATRGGRGMVDLFA